MIRNPVIWFEIYVQDMPRAKAFYEAVFQFKLSRLHSHDIEMWGFPTQKDGPGVTGSLVKLPGVASGGNSTLIYFSCTDCAVEAARVIKYGGSVHREKTPIGQYGFIVLAVDTEGNMIGLHSMQ